MQGAGETERTTNRIPRWGWLVCFRVEYYVVRVRRLELLLDEHLAPEVLVVAPLALALRLRHACASAPSPARPARVRASLLASPRAVRPFVSFSTGVVVASASRATAPHRITQRNTQRTQQLNPRWRSCGDAATVTGWVSNLSKGTSTLDGVLAIDAGSGIMSSPHEAPALPTSLQ
eukprot:1194661-Prorocentrum_minimum.AAC.4